MTSETSTWIPLKFLVTSGSTKKLPLSFASRRSFTSSAAVSAYSWRPIQKECVNTSVGKLPPGFSGIPQSWLQKWNESILDKNSQKTYGSPSHRQQCAPWALPFPPVWRAHSHDYWIIILVWLQYSNGIHTNCAEQKNWNCFIRRSSDQKYQPWNFNN